METDHLLHPTQWAEQTFGQARLGDRRRTRRAVKAAGAMVRDPAASLPQQHQTWKDLKAVSRLLDETDVTFEALMQPHWQQTGACLQAEAVVLLGQDTTEIDLSTHATMSGLGQIGNAKGRGFLLQTVLAVVPETQAVLGLSGAKTLGAYPCSQKRAALSTPPPRTPRNGCVDAEGRAERRSRLCWPGGAGGGSRRGEAALLSEMLGDPDPLCRSSCPEPSRAGQRGRDRPLAGPGACVAEPGAAPLCRGRQPWATGQADHPPEEVSGPPPWCLPGTTRVGAKTPCPSGWCGCGKASRPPRKKRLSGSC